MNASVHHAETIPGGMMRYNKLLAVSVLILFSTVTRPTVSNAADVKSVSCDRACLLSLQNTVFNKMLQHSRQGLPLAAGAQLTENGAVLGFSTGVWSRLKAVHARQDVVDSAGLGIATFAYVDDGEAPALLMLRLAVVDRKIVELEMMVTHKGESGHFHSGGIAFWDPLYDALLSPQVRSNREQLINVADLYFEGIDKADGTIVPFDRSCDRYENGDKVTNRLDSGAMGLSCGGGLSAIKPMFDRGMRERRYPIVDLERGLVVGIAFHESTPGPDVTYPSGFDPADFSNYPDAADVAAGRAASVPRPQALYVADIFKVVDGKLRQNDVFMKYLPYGTRTGHVAGQFSPSVRRP